MTLALVPLRITHIVEHVHTLLAPYRRTARNPDGFIDYWLVGGLYDGALTGRTSRVEYVDESFDGGGRLVGYRVPLTSYTPHHWLRSNQI